MAVSRDVADLLLQEGILERVADRLGWIMIVPEKEKWVLTFAGKFSRVIFTGPNIIWPGERLLARVKTDLFKVDLKPQEFDILYQQPVSGEEGKRMMAEFDSIGFAFINNAHSATLNFKSCIDEETGYLDTAKIVELIEEAVVVVLQEFVLEHDYQSLVEAPERRRFDQEELMNRMNAAFGRVGIKFALFKISDPGATREVKEALDDAAAAKLRAQAQLEDAKADREAAAIRAEAATARARAMFDLIKEVSREEGVSPELRSLVIQMATILEMTSEDRGPNAPSPVIVSGMGGGDASTGLVLAELRRLAEAVEKREQGGDGRHERE